ncbi:hypothetical protein ACJ73_03894 [Blastomyces percursus]|uniref:Uncharacterized protein n=1 Tax=Blastomyces percursus TaxID=1658174 RepID=A0A1J9QWX9_9EURO|nr:hypothetical protein ACJ73_03894 [Blastomyces percursus]
MQRRESERRAAVEDTAVSEQSNTHAFDGVLGIPGHRNAMRISMLHRVMAVGCDEVSSRPASSVPHVNVRRIIHYLNYVKDFWFSLVNDDPESVAEGD